MLPAVITSPQKFVESGQAEQAAKDLGNLSAEERAELEQAERERSKKIKETDPAVKRDYDSPG